MRTHITKIVPVAALAALVVACSDTVTQPGDSAGIIPVDTLLQLSPIDTLYSAQRSPVDTFASARRAPSDTVARRAPSDTVARMIPVDTLY